MITLTILLIITLLCILVGCLMGLFSLVGVIASLVAGVLVGALAGYVAGRFMGTETSLGRNILMGILGSLWANSCSACSAFMPPAASRPLSFQSSAPASASGSGRSCSIER